MRCHILSPRMNSQLSQPSDRSGTTSRSSIVRYGFWCGVLLRGADQPGAGEGGRCVQRTTPNDGDWDDEIVDCCLRSLSVEFVCVCVSVAMMRWTTSDDLLCARSAGRLCCEKKMNGWIGFEFVVALLMNGHTTHMQTDRSTLRCV